MKKNKKTKPSPLQKWTHWLAPLKHPVLIIVLFFLFIFAVFFTWKFLPKGTLNRTESLRFVQTLPPELKEKAISQTIISLQTRVEWLSERLAVLEKRMTQEPNLQKLISITLLEGVLEGRMTLEIFKIYLQKIPDPWAKDLLPALTPLKSSSTYQELEAMLRMSQSSPSPSLWERFEKNIRSFIQIRKVDTPIPEDGSQLENLHEALVTHDLQKALHLFEKLSPEEKTSLAHWKTAAQDRLTLEKTFQTLLLELAKG